MGAAAAGRGQRAAPAPVTSARALRALRAIAHSTHIQFFSFGEQVPVYSHADTFGTCSQLQIYCVNYKCK